MVNLNFKKIYLTWKITHRYYYLPYQIIKIKNHIPTDWISFLLSKICSALRTLWKHNNPLIFITLEVAGLLESSPRCPSTVPMLLLFVHFLSLPKSFAKMSSLSLFPNRNHPGDCALETSVLETPSPGCCSQFSSVPFISWCTLLCFQLIVPPPLSIFCPFGVLLPGTVANMCGICVPQHYKD